MRLPELTPEMFTPEQRASYDQILAGPRTSVDGPLWAWLHCPSLADVAQTYGAYCRFGTSISRRFAEIAILIAAAHWRASFEWQVHAPAARDTGIADSEIEAIRTHKNPGFTQPADVAVYEFCTELLEHRRSSEANYRSIQGLIGDKGVIELVGIMGYYSLVSLTLVSFEIPGLSGADDPFAEAS